MRHHAADQSRRATPAPDSPARRARVLALILAAGLALPMLAPVAGAQAAPDPKLKQKTPTPPSPSGANPNDRKPDPEANRRALEERDRRVREDAQRQAAEAEQRMREAQAGGVIDPNNPQRQGDLSQPGAPAFGAQPAPMGEAPPLNDAAPVPPDQLGDAAVDDGLISLNFPEPVDLAAFVDYVAKKLKVNFHIDGQLQGQSITFKAPISIPADQLLPLLSRLLEDKNFALTKDAMGWYAIVPPQNIQPRVGDDGELVTTKIIPTPMVRPSAIDAPVRSQLAQASGTNLRMTAIDEIGALVVTAPAGQIVIIEGLIDEIMKSLAEQKLHRIALENVAADYARERVITLNGRLGSGGGAPAAPAIPGQPNQPGGGASGSLTNLEQRLVSDQGNALIFRGRDEEVGTVRQLVAMVDVMTSLTAKRYTVGSAVNDVAQQGGRMGLGPVLSTAAGTGTTFGGFTGGGRTGQGRAGLGAQTATSDVATSGFSIDEESGSFIYYGTDAQHTTVERLVKEFVDQALNTRIEIQMYKLKHAKAESVVTVLNDLIQNRASGATSPFLPGSSRQLSGRERTGARDPNLGPAEPAAPDAPAGGDGEGLSVTFNEEDISIVEDTDRNQVLVKAPARQQREIARIIDRLDQRLPQVYLEVQIVSITNTDDFNWTVESQISAGDFLIFSNFGLTGVPSGGDAGSPRTVPGNRRGLTSAIIDEKYTPFVIRTLQENTDAKLVSSPRVLVNDNQEATIESTREEPFQSTSQNANTTITGQGGTATAGTTLTVTPQISEGGYLSLEYQIELSNFEGLPRTDGLQRPKQQERYESTVTVPSDSTIVVGGFSLDQQSESDSRIPILGDIPLIGNLFKDYSRNKRRTTIYVFITPTIMTDPNFLDLRLTTEGPLQTAQLDSDLPDLEPVTIPITAREVLRTRQLPRNEAAQRGPE